MERYCPAHDPIRRAGFLACVRCGQLAWPADAEWASDGLILVTYEPGCPHARPATVLVRAGHLRCIAFTREGLPCRNRPMSVSYGTCRLHWDANERRLAREQREAAP